MHDRIWNNCLSVIKDNVPSISFRTWFEPIVPMKLDGDILTIQVPSPFFYEYLEEQYIDILRKVIKKELGPEAKLEYNVVMQNNSYSNSKPYTVKFPARNSREIRNTPVSVPLDGAENT
ncbi:MAG: DnaA N-terminal domain-containing protein, partial [Bacteroides sp.]|nr:DnaA N-terminal domain-containing protein [Bacteroides sp.]